jgi:hypothetical protein
LFIWFGVAQATPQRLASSGDDVLDAIAGRVDADGPYVIQNRGGERANGDSDRFCTGHSGQPASPLVTTLAVIGRDVRRSTRVTGTCRLPTGPDSNCRGVAQRPLWIQASE